MILTQFAVLPSVASGKFLHLIYYDFIALVIAGCKLVLVCGKRLGSDYCLAPNIVTFLVHAKSRYLSPVLCDIVLNIIRIVLPQQ